jgi:hypothetical protein
VDLSAIIRHGGAGLRGTSSIYTPERFANTDLSAESRRLIQQSRDAQETIHLNRLLLQDAYPGEIKRSEQSDWIRIDLSQRRPWPRKGIPPDYRKVQTAVTAALQKEFGNGVSIEQRRYHLP